MTDRRFAKFAMGVAHTSASEAPEAFRKTNGRWRDVAVPVVDLRAEPSGARDRQFLLGTRFCVVTEDTEWSYGFDADEGYCGWVPSDSLGSVSEPTHWVSAPASHLYSQADLKSRELWALSCGARVNVFSLSGGFAQTQHGFVPVQHIQPIDAPASDPVAVARGFLNTPYLWGGNTYAGIDCSGLVQVARRACALPCPGDSDVQSRMIGTDIAKGEERAGDLIFWKGHVAMVTQPGWIIHANAHHMAVAEEPLDAAEVRIAAKGDLVTRRLRP